MNSKQNNKNIASEIADLQARTFDYMIWFVAAAGYGWVLWIFWPARLETEPIHWLGCSFLMGCTFLSLLFKNKNITVAASLLVIGAYSAVIISFSLLASPSSLYLFLLPIILSNVLFRTKVLLGITSLTTILFLTLTPQSLSFPDIVMPLIIHWVLVAALLISKYELHTALAWSLAGYEAAARNQQLARERHAELSRALKTLDTTTYNLERSNYMLDIARIKAEEAQRLKQQFAMNISHELRTPLNLIVGFTETMVNSPEYYGHKPLPPTYLQDLNTVYRNALHLQGLVSDVLDLARIEAAQLSLVLSPTNPALLVDEAVNTARSLVERSGLELHTDLETNLPTIYIDPVRIRQVLFNLLNNAARFTNAGCVTVSAWDEQEAVVFCVADTGVGITPEDRSRVFEAFHQVDGTTQRQHEGAGLGLAICKHFVELHGGSIWVESKVDEGSQFFFSLPVDEMNQSGVFRENGAQEQYLHHERWQRERVLLAITKSSSAAVLLTRYVKDCRVAVAGDIEQAKDIVQKIKPQIVLIDTISQKSIAPPNVEQTLEALAEEWGIPATPFIACPLPGEERLRQYAGADGYLIKPVSQQMLWQILRQFEANIDRVLVVDDDRDFVRLMNRLLDNPLRRHEVFNAYSGREALDMAGRYKPDLILLDVRLPDIDGFAVLARIRKIPALQKTPVVIVSGQDEFDTMEVMHGATIITKNIGVLPGEVIRWIQSVLDSTTNFKALLSQGENLE